MSHELPDTLAECHELLKAERMRGDAQQATIDQQQELIRKLQRDFALLKRSLFGHRRERFEDPRQGNLFDAAFIGEFEEAAADENEGLASEACSGSLADPKAPRRRGRQRRVIPECIPRVKRVRRLNDEDIPEGIRNSGRVFEKKVGEYIEWTTAQLQVIEEYVEVIAVDNDDATETTMHSASREPRIIDSLAGPSLLAALAVGRFMDHMPYYRLEEQLERSSLVLDRATQSRWMKRLAEQLTPLVDLMREMALMPDVAQADETPVKRLVPGEGKAATSYLWAVLGGPYTTYYYTDDRSRAGPDSFFEDFTGTLVSDAYICYERLDKTTRGRVKMAGCHVHARRKFEALHKLGETSGTSTALGYFQRLLAIEDALVEMSNEERHEQRQLRCRPLMVDFKRWLDEQLMTLRPKHELRGAISYMTTRWECFVRFLESGAIPIHNNASEQAVKLPVIGKKNWLFFGNSQGGHTAATFFTLTATCRQLKMDPLSYLTDIFQRIPRCDCEDRESLIPLLPDRWLADHPESRLVTRVNESETKAEAKRKNRAKRRKAAAKIKSKR